MTLPTRGIVGACAVGVCAMVASADDVESMTFGDAARWANGHAELIMGILGLISMVVLWRLRVLRVGGLDAGGRDVRPIPAIMWLFCGITTWIGILLGGSLGLELIGPIEGDGSPQDQAVLTIVAYGFASVVGLGVLWFVAKQASESGTKPGWIDLPLGVGLFVVVMPLVALAGVLANAVARGLDTVQQDPLAHNTLRLIAQNRDNPWNWALIAAIVVLVPIAEELTFRVYFQSMFLRIVRSRWVAVLATSAVFTAAHWTAIPADGKHALASIFVLSVALGAAYERSGRLGVPIVMHMCFNALNILIAFVITPIAE